MAKKFLFEGKDIHTNKWVYGYYWTNGLGNHFIRVTQEPDGKYVIEDYEVYPTSVHLIHGGN